MNERLDEEVQRLSSDVNERIDAEISNINERIQNLEDALSAVLARMENAALSLNGGSCTDSIPVDYTEESRRLLLRKGQSINVGEKLVNLESILEKIHGKLEEIEA